MHHEHQEDYQPYLQPGMGIGTGLPLAGGGLLRDTAIIAQAKGNTLLITPAAGGEPAGACSEPGCLLNVRITVREHPYTSSAVITEKPDAETLRIRLFGGFSQGEMHEVFRLRSEMKIRYAATGGLDGTELAKDWNIRRHLEHIKYQSLGELALAAERARYRAPEDLEWHDLRRGTVSLLGSDGVALRLPEPMPAGELLYLEMQLPLDPPRTIPAVVRVLAAKAPEQAGRRSFHESWMEFVHLHKKDHELILQHLSVAQRGQLREIAVQHAPEDEEVIERVAARGRRSILVPVLGSLVLVALVYGIISIFTRSHEAPPAGEIQSTYEQAIKQHRGQGE